MDKSKHILRLMTIFMLTEQSNNFSFIYSYAFCKFTEQFTTKNFLLRNCFLIYLKKIIFMVEGIDDDFGEEIEYVEKIKK